MTILRLLLPRLATLDPQAAIPFVRFDKRGAAEAGQATLTDLASRWPGTSLQAILHPTDATITEVRMPPLPPSKLRQAMGGVIDGLVLAGRATVVASHGPRLSNGLVPVVWANEQVLRDAAKRLLALGFGPAVFVPAPFCLAHPAPAPAVAVAGQVSPWTAWLHAEGYIVVRTGTSGFVHPIVEESTEAAISRLLARHQPGDVSWVHELPQAWNAQHTAAATMMPVVQGWAGGIPTWACLRADDRDAGTAGAWRRPALVWVGAVAVWLLGLNLYAAVLASEGREINRAMVDRVRAEFPGAGSGLNPLQQARQLRDAQQQAVTNAARAEFGGMVAILAEHAGFAAGDIRTLRYEPGILHLELEPDAAPAKEGSQPDWTEAILQAGLRGQQEGDKGWVVRPAEPEEGGQ